MRWPASAASATSPSSGPATTACASGSTRPSYPRAAWPPATWALFQLPGSNALQTADTIKKEMKKLKDRFPAGVDYKIVYDTTVFVEESISAVYHTLIEAFILVFIVVLVFLQNWRATIIP